MLKMREYSLPAQLGLHSACNTFCESKPTRGIMRRVSDLLVPFTGPVRDFRAANLTLRVSRAEQC